MNQAVNLDQILPHNQPLEHRLDKDNIHKWLQNRTAEHCLLMQIQFETKGMR
jgi:hypothetical protein